MVSQPISSQHASMPAEVGYPEVVHPFAANAIRLSNRLWVVTAVLVASALIAIPRVWEHSEHFDSSEDARMPYSLSDDYWYFDRHVRGSTSEDQIVVLGDS